MDNDKYSALDYACENGHFLCVSELISLENIKLTKRTMKIANKSKNIKIKKLIQQKINQS